MQDAPVAVITGAARGLGLESARQLAARDYRVIITGRDESRLAEALQSLPKSASARLLDPSSDASVQDFTQWLDEQTDHLDVLINNAGRLYLTEEGALPDARHLLQAVDNNALSAWRLTLALQPLLDAAPHACVVNVSSGMGALTEMGPGAEAYRLSKTALNAVTRMLFNILPVAVKVNSVCPGWVRTDMGGAQAERAVEEGAASIVWAATLGQNGPSGGFYRDGNPLDW